MFNTNNNAINVGLRQIQAQDTANAKISEFPPENNRGTLVSQRPEILEVGDWRFVVLELLDEEGKDDEIDDNEY